MLSSNGTETTPCLLFQQQYDRKYGRNHLPFQACSLSNALEKSCFTELNNRKMLALYLHHDDDVFSKVLCPLLSDERLINLLEVYCLFLPWDITNVSCLRIIKEMIRNYNELDFIEFRVNQKKGALLLIAPIDNTITLFGILQGKMKENDVIEKVKLYCESFEIELECEKKLLQTRNADTVKINSRQYQQMMFDMLGDRDYDAFEEHQHDYLKEKIGFAFYGPPQDVDGYNEKQKQKIDAVYKKICEIYEPHAEYEKQIIISFIYNCTEPLPQEKEKRLKQSKEKGDKTYDPETDILPQPIFVLRKCIANKTDDDDLKTKHHNPCRIFIDHDLRVYTTWDGYIANNKLPPCKMVLPKDGRYKGDGNGDVLLEYHLSPLSGIKADVLKGLDITSTVLGLGSGAVFAVALIPTLTVAPVALIGAGIVGALVGTYSIVRSAVNLADRNKHCEDMSLLNAEARGSYINIVAGSLGFVGAGATTAVSQLVAQGVNVGKAGQAAVTAINVINLGASGAGILHSSYEVYIQWRDENVAPSALTILQLSSSVLFFGNAVYNFRTGAAIVEETQTKVLQEYQDGLRSNRHRKTFNKLRLETIRQNEGNVARGQAEVIATIRQIPDQNEVFAILTRSNRNFNENKIRFAASGGKITLNGMAVDISKFGSLSKPEQTAFLLELPSTPLPTQAQASAITRVINTVFHFEYVNVCGQILAISQWNFAKILNLFQPLVQELLLKCLRTLLDTVSARMNINEIFKSIMPHCDLLDTILRLVIDFFKTKMVPYEEDYRRQREVEQQMTRDFDESDFAARNNTSENVGSRALIFFERAVQTAFNGGDVKGDVLMELVDYFTRWISEQIYNFEERRQARVNRGLQRELKECKECGGKYFWKGM